MNDDIVQTAVPHQGNMRHRDRRRTLHGAGGADDRRGPGRHRSGYIAAQPRFLTSRWNRCSSTWRRRRWPGAWPLPPPWPASAPWRPWPGPSPRSRWRRWSRPAPATSSWTTAATSSCASTGRVTIGIFTGTGDDPRHRPALRAAAGHFFRLHLFGDRRPFALLRPCRRGHCRRRKRLSGRRHGHGAGQPRQGSERPSRRPGHPRHPRGRDRGAAGRRRRALGNRRHAAAAYRALPWIRDSSAGDRRNA